MAGTWQEVKTAATENRRELVLQGPQISKRIDKAGLDASIYDLVNLNYLEISSTTLSQLDSGLGKLQNLTSLILCNNKISEVPVDIGHLKKLKLLNVANNNIKSIPEELCSLAELHTLNLSMNKLSTFPSIRDLKNIHILNVSNNALDELPDGIYNADLVHLSQILASDNQITELSPDVEDLPHLNILDLSTNKLVDVPAELCLCPRLKELNLKSNKFKDRRFGKMVEQCAFKSVVDYLQNILKKENQKSGKGEEKDLKKKKKKKGKKAMTDEVEEITKNIISVLHFSSETGIVIEVSPAVMSVRQYIVCCLVRNLNLQKTNNAFKNFISYQTKLHDTVCQKRQAATIATHDFKSVKLPIRYDARLPQMLEIVPLFKQKAVSGEKLFADLRHEADELRKEKKRSTLSGIHKYLELLDGKTQYPCLLDAEDNVISFPPITNSDKTKISKETREILVEVTSSTSLDSCKKVMDELLLKMLESSLGAASTAEGATAAKGDDSDSDDGGVVFEKSPKKVPEKLVVEQVKITDHEGNLRVVYPSRTDLLIDGIEVIRHFEI